MTAYQPNPEQRNDDDMSPTQYDLGWRAVDTLAANPFVSPAVKKRFAEKAGVPRLRPVSKVPDGDSSLDENWNVSREPLTPEQVAIKEKGMQVLRRWRDFKEDPDVSAEPGQLVLPGLEYIDEIYKRREAIKAEAAKEELEIARRIAAGEIPDYDLSDPDYRFWKRPEEREIS